MLNAKETAEKLVRDYSFGLPLEEFEGRVQDITTALEQAERAGYARGIEAASKYMQRRAQCCTDQFGDLLKDGMDVAAEEFSDAADDVLGLINQEGVS